MKSTKKRASGGEVESPKTGEDDYKEDLAKKNQRYTYESKVNDEAEERKRGGKVKKKNVGKVKGEAKPNAGRMPRKSGGRAGGSNASPFSSARAGTPPKGHKTTAID